MHMRFMSELEKRYDWTAEELLAEWESAKTNPKAIWSTDDYGESVCSLLKVTSAGTSRQLNHRKSVETEQSQLTDDMASTFKSSLTQFWFCNSTCMGHWDCIQTIVHLAQHTFQHFRKRRPGSVDAASLHQDTRIFDQSRRGPMLLAGVAGLLARNKLIHVVQYMVAFWLQAAQGIVFLVELSFSYGSHGDTFSDYDSNISQSATEYVL